MKQTKLLIPFICLCLNFAVNAQSGLGLEIMGNYPFVSGGKQINDLVSTTVDSKPGISISTHSTKPIIKKLFFDMGMGFSNINLKNNSYYSNAYLYPNSVTVINGFYTFVPPETIVEVEKNHGRTTLLYFDLPLNLKFEIMPNRIQMQLGITPSYLFYSKQISHTLTVVGRTNTPNIPDDVYYKDKDENGLNKFTFNANFGINIRISKRMWLLNQYHHGIVPIYNENNVTERSNYIIKTGIYYTIR